MGCQVEGCLISLLPQSFQHHWSAGAQASRKGAPTTPSLLRLASHGMSPCHPFVLKVTWLQTQTIFNCRESWPSSGAGWGNAGPSPSDRSLPLNGACPVSGTWRGPCRVNVCFTGSPPRSHAQRFPAAAIRGCCGSASAGDRPSHASTAPPLVDSPPRTACSGASSW